MGHSQLLKGSNNPAPELLRRAKARREAGAWGEAEALYRQVLTAAPDNPYARYWLAVIAGRNGNHDEALRLIDAATRARPGNVGLLCEKGRLYAAAGRPREAASCFRQAASLEPKNVAALIGLGGSLLDAGRQDLAVAPLRRAVQLAPGNANAFHRLGQAYQKQKRYDEAVENYRRVLALNPNHGAAALNLGLILQGRGDFAEAIDLFERVIRIAPASGAAHYELARSRKYRPGDRHIQEMERVLADMPMPPDQRRYLHYALAKAYDDVGDADAAMRHCHSANRIDPPPFDRAAHARQIDRLIELFSRKFLSERTALGQGGEKLVFIVGMPRSGTTLVDQVLAAHPRVRAAGELVYFRQLEEWLPSRLGKPYPECVREAGPELLREAQQGYLKLFGDLPDGISRITNKFPENFLALGLIALLFPQARIVHCRRDPLDICLSCYFQFFRRGQDFSFDLGDLGFYYRQYERLMAHWREALPNPFVEVSYERLVADFEGESRRLIEFLGLDWDERCLEFFRNRNTVGTASVWQVRQPVYSSSVGRYKAYEPWLGPLREALESVPKE